MPFIKSIGSRIFGLAVFLVCLMISLAGFLLWQVTTLNAELRGIAGYFAPLSQHLVDLNEAGLRRRLAFERWFGSLSSNVDRTAAREEAEANYAKFTTKIQEALTAAQTLLASPPPGSTGQLELGHIRSTVDQVAATYVIVTKHQAEILRLMKQGETVRAADLLNVLDDIQATMQTQRSELQRVIGSVLAASTLEASQRHREVFWTTALATLTSVLLGLSFAALVTRRLVQPVRSLMTGIQSAEKGDFTVQLPVHSADEIGALTQSFNFFIGEMRLKEEMRTTFGKYIDPRILERVILDPASAEARGGRQDMAVSFADLVGFTEIGEHLTPAGVVNLLNRHFTEQAEAIQRHHGVVDKFMGDAVMAFWGPPFTKDNDYSLLACHGALHQVRAIERLRALLPEVTGLRRNLPHIDVRIGISSGEVIVGNIGSENTRSYTVIGDTVNLAARLEQANRFYGTRILICGTTRAGAGAAVVAREIDTIVVKGKTETTRIFELLGLADEATADALALCERSAAALAAYRARDWDAAEGLFRECLAIAATDRVAPLFLDRIAAFRLTPPGVDWTGAWVFDAK